MRRSTGCFKRFETPDDWANATGLRNATLVTVLPPWPVEPSGPEPRCRRSRRIRDANFLGMILGALLLVAGVYVYEFDADVERRQRPGRRRPTAPSSTGTSRPTDWKALKTRAHEDWIRISSK